MILLATLALPFLIWANEGGRVAVDRAIRQELIRDPRVGFGDVDVPIRALVVQKWNFLRIKENSTTVSGVVRFHVFQDLIWDEVKHKLMPSPNSQSHLIDWSFLAVKAGQSLVLRTPWPALLRSKSTRQSR